MNKTRIITAAAAVLVLGTVAGCAQKSPVAGEASPAAVVQDDGAAAGQDNQAAALVATESVLGTILTDGKGMTLYRFDKDTAKPPKSNCDGDCAVAWPPLEAPSAKEVAVTGVDSALVGTVLRSDGRQQVTVSGWPVYRYFKDAKPGDTNGQGVGGTWFAITPQGKKATGKAPTDVALVAMKVGKLGMIITDREGMTLYRFDKDTAKPSKSNCEGECAATWPPVITSSEKVQVTGVDPELVGTVTRADGSRQVTVGGWPLYRYVKDTKSCDTFGQGVGGVWFATTPQGKKAGV